MSQNDKIQTRKQKKSEIESNNLFFSLLRFSKKVRVSDKIYDVSPLSYKLIEQTGYHYLFLKDKSDFYQKVVLSQNPICKIDDSFIGISLFNRFSFFEIYFSYICGRGIFDDCKFSLESPFGFRNFRDEIILRSKWTNGELNFLTFHDFLIYEICLGYIKRKNKKVFLISSGAKRVIMTMSPTKKKIKKDKSPIEAINSYIKNMADETGKDVVVNDDFSEFLFDKEKLENSELLSISSIYEFWSEKSSDFSEEMLIEDLDDFSKKVSQILDDKAIQELLFKIYRNLVNFRKYNFANTKIEKDPEIGLKIKENIDEMVLLLKENQDLIVSYIPKESPLKNYFPINITDKLDAKLNTIIRFCKIRNYTNQFIVNHLINNQTLAAFIEEDGAFYKVIGINNLIKQNDFVVKALDLPSNLKVLSDVSSKFSFEGKLKNITIFDHHTNKKRILSEEYQIYVDSKELLNLLMDDFFIGSKNIPKADEEIDLEELTNLFSEKVRDRFIKNEEKQGIENSNTDKVSIQQILVSYEKEDNNLNINFLMKDGSFKKMSSAIKPEYSQIMDDVFCKNLETKIKLTDEQYDYFSKKLKDNLKSEIKNKVELDCKLQDKIFKLSSKTASQKSIQIISKTYPKNS